MKNEAAHWNDNTYLCSLDMSHASKEEKTAWLMQIINNELDRGKEADEQLIMECAEHLELLSSELGCSSEPREVPPMLTAHHMSSARKSNGSSLAVPGISERLHRVMLRLAATVAVFAMIVLFSPKIYAHTLVERDNKLYQRAIGHNFLNAETSLSDKLPERAYEALYSDLPAFFRNHGYLDFHYPGDLPEPQAIQTAGIIYHSAKSWIIVFSFDDPNIKNFIVQRLSQPVNMIDDPQTERYFSAGTQKYALSEKEENGRTVFTAECYTDNLRYTAEAYDLNTLKLVLSKTSTTVSRRFSSMDEFLETYDYLQEFLYPKHLPDALQFNSVQLVYRSSANWSVTMQFDQPKSSNHGNKLTVSPIADPSSLNLGTDPPILSNDTVKIYLTSGGFSPTYGHYEAVCVVGNMKYTMRIYGYTQFVAFAESLFGALS
ncbi:MAG: hypothetical protein IJW99_10465 [Clostridia bacterium]|nr:hypothetical protein [Clostridia bacterium]